MWRSESGQAAVEMGIILSAVFMLTVGLFDVSRGFFAYNQVASAARFGARWGSVVGGTCGTPESGTSVSDWCDQQGGTAGSAFWSVGGNAPVQGNSTCPTSQSGASGSNSYQLSSYEGSTSTTIVGAIYQRFDTNSSSTGGAFGQLMPALDPTKARVCIQLPSKDYNSGSQTWTVYPSDTVTVYVYYPFNAISSLITTVTLPLVAEAQYTVE